MLEHVGTVRRMPGWKGKTDAVFRRPRRWWEFEGFFDAQDTNERLFRLCLHTDELLAFEISKSLGRQNRWLCVAEPNFNTFQHHFSIISASFQPFHVQLEDALHFELVISTIFMCRQWAMLVKAHDQCHQCSGSKVSSFNIFWNIHITHIMIIWQKQCAKDHRLFGKVHFPIFERLTCGRAGDGAEFSSLPFCKGNSDAWALVPWNWLFRCHRCFWQSCLNLHGFAWTLSRESLAIISSRYYLMAWLSLWAFWPEPVAT